MATQTDRYDFFVSYATPDNSNEWISDFVDGILAEHKRHGGPDLTYFFDKSSIRDGNDWSNTLLHGIAESRVLLAFISPNYFASDWCRKEWRAWVETEIAKHVFSDGASPICVVAVPGLEDRHISARNVSEAIAAICGLNAPQDEFLTESTPIVHQIRRRQIRSVYLYKEQQESLSNPKLRSIMAEITREVQTRVARVRQAVESASTIPPYNTNFTGRVDDLLNVREHLKSDLAGVICGLHGLGGIGKTELAFTYAHAFAVAYPGGRLLMPCEGRRSVREAAMTLAEFDEFRSVITEEDRKTTNGLFSAVLACLSRRLQDKGAILLVLDNVTSEALMSRQETDELTKLGPALHLLMTTRLAPPPGGSWITVSELPESDAMDLLEKHRGFSNAAERDAAKRIVRRLGGFAIAVELVAAWLVVHEGSNYISIAATLGLEDLETIAGDETVELRRHNHERRITAVLEPVLAGLDLLTRRIIEMAAFLPPDAVALPWLKTLVRSEIPDALNPKGLIADPWVEACSRLTKLALFSRAGETDHGWRVRVHRLVQDVVKHRMSTQRLQECQQAVDTLVQARDAVLESTTKWDGVRWEIDALEALASYWSEGHHPGTPWLLSQVGLRWYGLGEWARAEPLLRRGLSICEAVLPAGHPEIALHLSYLAALLKETHQLTEAEVLLRRALSIKEAHYGRDHPGLASNLNNLGSVLAETGRLGEAEALLRRALALEEAHHGTDSPEVSSSLGNLAGLLAETNRLTEAESLMRRVLEITQKYNGPDHPQVAIRLNNLAELLQATNRHKEAEPLMRKALVINDTSFGPNHPHVAANLNNLSQLLQATNRHDEAEPFLRRALVITEARFGPHHPRVAFCLDNLGLLLHATGRYDDAEPLMRRAIDIEVASYGANHPDTGTGLNNLALLLQSTGRLSEAEALSRRALEISIASYGPDHPDVARDLNCLAVSLAKMNRLPDAEPLMRRHLEIYLKFTRTNKHEHPNLRSAVGNYAAILRAMKLPQTRVIERLKALGPEPPAIFVEKMLSSRF